MIEQLATIKRMIDKRTTQIRECEDGYNKAMKSIADHPDDRTYVMTNRYYADNCIRRIAALTEERDALQACVDALCPS